MRKILYTLLLLATVACSKEAIEKDNDAPVMYLPHYGFSFNDIWNLQSGTDTHYITVYCSGLYNGASSNITVNYSIDPALISTYNNDITQLYSGMVKELPAQCYTIGSGEAVIEKGKSEVKIPIEFNLSNIAQMCTEEDVYYTIPIRLSSASQYALHSNVSMTEALYSIRVNEPVFYFFDNRNGVVVKDIKVLYGGGEQHAQYLVCCQGVPDGSYTLNMSYNPDVLDSQIKGGTALPSDAFEIVQPSLSFPNIFAKPKLDVKFAPEKLAFRQVYYLPISISNPSAYIADPERGTLFVKVEVKNQYDKNYISKMSIHSGTSSRTGSYEAEKTVSSYENDIVEMQMGTNATIAGAGNTGTSTTYDDKYMRLKVIPGSDPSKYAVEIVLVTDKAKANNSPASLELDPEKESYYNWNMEEFVLNYRWKHTDGKYITVSEILSAK